MRRLALAAAFGALLLVFSAAAYAYEAEPVVHGTTITGVVKYDGVAPKPKRLEIGKDKEVCGAHPIFDESLVVGHGGGIKNAVVTITDISRGVPMVPEKAVIFDQKGCEYLPHLVAFPAGSTVKVINSDGILHSVHTDSSINQPLDMAQPAFKKTISVTIAKPEIIMVDCDAHNWMKGWWYVVGNPYYAVTDRTGHFKIANVPPGTYTMQIWQENLGTVKRKVTVVAGKLATVNFTMKPHQEGSRTDD
jgi:plastocyanin